jgi:hypothetical protein
MIDGTTRYFKSPRSRTRKRGLRRVEVRVPASEVAVIRKAATILCDRTEEAAQLRRHLGFDPEASGVLTALDIFAMPEPLSIEGEKLWDEAMKQVERDRKNSRLGRPRDIDL